MRRGQKTVRNLALCALLGALVYTMLGFPPYTVRGMLDRVERLYLLSDLEPVLVVRDSWRYSNNFLPHHVTHLIARTGTPTSARNLPATAWRSGRSTGGTWP